ncbi:MAG: EAL domain-containing protein [Bradymonadia bacterium]
MNAHALTSQNKTLAVLHGREGLSDVRRWLADDGFEVQLFPEPGPILEAMESGASFVAVLIDLATAPGVEIIKRMKSMLAPEGSKVVTLDGAHPPQMDSAQREISEEIADAHLPNPLTQEALRAALGTMQSLEGEEAPLKSDSDEDGAQILAQVMIHDVRAGLMAMQQRIEQMSNVELLSPAGRRDLDALMASSRMALKRIEQVRRTHGELVNVQAPETQSVKVRELIREASAAVGFAAGMVTWLPRNADPELEADPVMFRRVLEHLLLNAQVYGEGTAELKVRIDGRRLVVEVGDRGPGLSEELAAGNYQLAEEQVGLAYVDEVLKAHGGQLELAPRDEGGLLVRTVWPNLINNGEFDDGAAMPRVDHARLNVWLVDDEPMVLKATARLLRMWGHDTKLFESGEAMLKSLPLAEPPPDLVLCDANLTPSGMRGLEVLGRTRSLAPRTSRMLYTAFGADTEVVDAFNQGVVHRYIQKGSEYSVLKRCIDAVVQERRQLSTGRLSPDDETLRARFEDMLAGEKLTLHLQPIFDARTRQIVACEALMRSLHPDFRGPLDILDAAKTFDRDIALQKVLTRLAQRIRLQLPEHMLLFVNVDPGLVTSVHHVDAVLGDLYPVAGQVILEMTERARLGTDPAQAAAVERLREVGFRLALDDVGAGYNSLAAVVAVEPEVLKLDISLVSGLDKDDRKAEMVRLLVEYAGRHGIDTVAEGIERPEEAVTCTNMGVRWLQGYHFCKPMALEALADKYGFALR